MSIEDRESSVLSSEPRSPHRQNRSIVELITHAAVGMKQVCENVEDIWGGAWHAVGLMHLPLVCPYIIMT